MCIRDSIDSEEVKVDVGWRGYRTDEFEVVGNKHLITASEKVRQEVCKHFNLEGYSISSHFHLSHTGTKKTVSTASSFILSATSFADLSILIGSDEPINE